MRKLLKRTTDNKHNLLVSQPEYVSLFEGASNE